MVSGKPKVLLIDTGAAFTIIKDEKEFQTNDTNINLISVTGSPIKITGEATVTISAERTSHNMSVILVDSQTPIAVDGLLGADFLFQIKAVLDIENSSLMFNDNIVQLDVGEDKVVGAIIPVKYSFHNSNEECQVITKQNVTIASQSQQVLHAKLQGVQI